MAGARIKLDHGQKQIPPDYESNETPELEAENKEVVYAGTGNRKNHTQWSKN